MRVFATLISDYIGVKSCNTYFAAYFLSDFQEVEEGQVATNNQGPADDYERALDTFELLYELIVGILAESGFRETPGGDYSIYDGYLGHSQVKVSIVNLEMLEPVVIERLQQVVKAHPAWEIVVAVVNRSNYGNWPEMGLYIRPHEIIDGLQRQYFPQEFQNVQYKGARRGTVND